MIGEIQVVQKTERMASLGKPVTLNAPGAEAATSASAVSDDHDSGIYTTSGVAWLARDKTYWRVPFLRWEPGHLPIRPEFGWSRRRSRRRGPVVIDGVLSKRY